MVYSYRNNFCFNNLFQSAALACIQLCWSDRLMRKMMMVQTVWWDNMFQLLQVCSGKYTKENENNCYTSSQVTLRYPRSGIVKLHSDSSMKLSLLPHWVPGASTIFVKIPVCSAWIPQVPPPHPGTQCNFLLKYLCALPGSPRYPPQLSYEV